MANCPACKASLGSAPGASCPSCGCVLERAPGHVSSPSCPTCGVWQASPSALFCRHCGARLDGEVQSPGPKVCVCASPSERRMTFCDDCGGMVQGDRHAKSPQSDLDQRPESTRQVKQPAASKHTPPPGIAGTFESGQRLLRATSGPTARQAGPGGGGFVLAFIFAMIVSRLVAPGGCSHEEPAEETGALESAASTALGADEDELDSAQAGPESLD